MSNTSWRKLPLRAGRISETAEARLSHLQLDFDQLSTSVTTSGNLSMRSPIVWLQKLSHFAQLSMYRSIQVLNMQMSPTCSWSIRLGSQVETTKASSMYPERK